MLGAVIKLPALLPFFMKNFETRTHFRVSPFSGTCKNFRNSEKSFLLGFKLFLGVLSLVDACAASKCAE